MRMNGLTTTSRFFTCFGWARFMGAGFFGMVRDSGIK